MAITFSTFSAGTAITQSAVTTAFTSLRNWLNAGIVVGDMDAASIDERHIYRPDTFGFPKVGTEAQTQEAYERSFAVEGLTSSSYSDMGDGVADVGIDIANLNTRTSIFTEFLFGGDAMPVQKAGARVVLERAAMIDIAAVWEAQTQYSSDLASALVHPEPAGFFILVYQEIGDASASDLSATRRDLNAAWLVAAAYDRSSFHTFNTGTQIPVLAAGTYDFWLEYRADSINRDIAQVIIGPRHIVIEVHYD